MGTKGWHRCGRRLRRLGTKDVSRGFSFLTLGLLTLSGAHMVTHVFGRIHTALFPVFREEFHLSLQQLGVMASIPPLCQALFNIPSGLLTDRFGQKTLIILSFVTAGSAALAVGLSTSPIALVIFLSILIASVTIYHPPAYSLTSTLFPKANRGRALGVHGAGGTLGMALGPITLSIFMGYLLLSWRSIYIFWAFPLFLYILAIWRLKTPEAEESPGREEAPERAEARTPATGMRSVLTPAIIGFMAFQAARNMGNQMIDTFIPTYLHDAIGLTVSGASLIYGVASLTGVAAAPIGGYLTDRLGDKRWLQTAVGASALLLILSALTSNIALFALLYWSSGFFNYSGMGAASSIIARATPASRRGLGYSLYFLPGSVVNTVSPIIGAYIAEAFGLWNIFPAAVVVIVLSLVVLRLGVPSG